MNPHVPRFEPLTVTLTQVILMCHALNDAYKEVVVGYTFDAGPNAVLLTTKAHMPSVLAAVLHYFPPPPEKAPTFVNKPALRASAEAATLPESMATSFKLPPQQGSIKYVYATGIGPGAAELPAENSLVDERGMPLFVKPPPKIGRTSSIAPLVATVVCVLVYTLLKKP